VDDHVTVEVVGQVELFAAARVGTHLGPPLSVYQVHVVLERRRTLLLFSIRTLSLLTI